MKNLLRKYQNNELNTIATEQVERRFVKEAIGREERRKWYDLLSENGIERTSMPNTAEISSTATPVLIVPDRRRVQRRLIMGVAASLLLVACFWWWDMRTSSSASDFAHTALFSQRFATPSVRMGQNEDLKNWADAKSAYHDGYFEKAVGAIKAIPILSIEQQFYLSLSYIYQTTPDFENAALGFKNIIDKGDGNFRDESRWYYALVCVKLGRNEEAKQYLSRIVNENSWKSKEAKVLLAKIK